MKEYSSILLNGRNDCRRCVRELIELSTQRVYLIGQNLEPDLYNHKYLYDHLSELTTRNRNTDIRVIAHDTRVAARNGHYLILLAQRLPTFAQIRITVTRDQRKFSENWLIVDDMAFMRIKNPASYEGYYDTDNKLECRSLAQSFMEIWEASLPDQNTRRLGI
ncbi:MAG: hypothetical protein IIB69_07640 [Proteobacteria bacterium]|nr:hypothetical protein [Pseudomonadota bacterium]